MNRLPKFCRPWMATICCMVPAALATHATTSHADAPGAEPAIMKAADDAGLQWGPCPDFLPAGCGIAVLHGDPSQPNVDVLFRVPGSSEIPPHSHTSAERMVLISGELHVTYEGQPPAELKPGTYAYGPAGRVHSARCASDLACVLFIAFESPLDAIPSGGSQP